LRQTSSHFAELPAGNLRDFVSILRMSIHKEVEMPAGNPEQICSLFKQYMAAGDLESLLDIYDPEVVFLSQSQEVLSGREGLRQVLAPLAAAKAKFDFNIKQVIQSGDIALMHTEWKVSAPEQMYSYAIEVARRQYDGTWRWLIGDPFTVGRETGANPKAA
jgi:uncharacterized protein (TIGR02246 family)